MIRGGSHTELQFSGRFQVKTGSGNYQMTLNRDGCEMAAPQKDFETHMTLTGSDNSAEKPVEIVLQGSGGGSRGKSSIRAVAFDAVGTLMYAMPSVSTVYCEILGHLSGRSVDSDEVRSVLSRRLAARSSEGNLTTDEESEQRFWFHLIAELVPDPERQVDCFQALYRHFADPAHWRCYHDVPDVLESLTSKGVSLVIASNFDVRLHAVCDGLTELQTISDRIISSEAGWRKPARQFFDIVCQRTACRPEEVLFVGDDPHNDVLGAQLAGMPAVLLDRHGEPPGAADILPSTASTQVRRIHSLRELGLSEFLCSG